MKKEVVIRRTADVLQFLLNWCEIFPEYRANELYLTGESYRGHCLPTLAREIVWHNDTHQVLKVGLSSILKDG
jgi:carboxypeptidase C (cathepsin A)